MVVRKAAIGDVEKLAILFDKYRVFYEKQSDLIEAKFFYLIEYLIMSRGLLSQRKRII